MDAFKHFFKIRQESREQEEEEEEEEEVAAIDWRSSSKHGGPQFAARLHRPVDRERFFILTPDRHRPKGLFFPPL